MYKNRRIGTVKMDCDFQRVAINFIEAWHEWNIPRTQQVSWLNEIFGQDALPHNSVLSVFFESWEQRELESEARSRILLLKCRNILNLSRNST